MSILANFNTVCSLIYDTAPHTHTHTHSHDVCTDDVGDWIQDYTDNQHYKNLMECSEFVLTRIFLHSFYQSYFTVDEWGGPILEILRDPVRFSTIHPRISKVAENLLPVHKKNNKYCT